MIARGNRRCDQRVCRTMDSVLRAGEMRIGPRARRTLPVPRAWLQPPAALISSSVRAPGRASFISEMVGYFSHSSALICVHSAHFSGT